MLQEQSLRSTRQNYDRLSGWYDLFSFSERRLTSIGLQMLNVQPGEKVLEIGFGTGHALIALADAVGKAGKVSGIDLSPGMLHVADRLVKQSGLDARIFIQVGNAITTPYSAHLFQAVFMSFTLELFPAEVIPALLAECRRVLLPGGRLGIVALSKKETRAVSIYEWFHRRFPKVVDCRPILVETLLEEASFVPTQFVEEKLWGLPVVAVVAKKA